MLSQGRKKNRADPTFLPITKLYGKVDQLSKHRSDKKHIFGPSSSLASAAAAVGAAVCAAVVAAAVAAGGAAAATATSPSS